MNMNDTTTTAPPGDTSYLGRPGGRIGYDVAGAGPLVVLVPGMGDLGLPTGSSPRPCGRRATGSPARTCAVMVTATPRSRPTEAGTPPKLPASAAVGVTARPDGTVRGVPRRWLRLEGAVLLAGGIGCCPGRAVRAGHALRRAGGGLRAGAGVADEHQG
jgi:hypothetical protein